jgi:hypothetical protein
VSIAVDHESDPKTLIPSSDVDPDHGDVTRRGDVTPVVSVLAAPVEMTARPLVAADPGRSGHIESTGQAQSPPAGRAIRRRFLMWSVSMSPSGSL